jgi:DNA-binding beta-propeller fold protein YncE
MRMPVLKLTLALWLGLLSATVFVQQKGGESETGPYDVVVGWFKSPAKPGYLTGSVSGIVADTPNRIFVATRGELKQPDKLPRNFDGTWGSFDQRATVPDAEIRNCILVVDASGKTIETWTQWDRLFDTNRAGSIGPGPHKIKISPYDPERHVWVVNDSAQQIYEFTNDGKQLVMTLGERGVAGADEKHFGRPQDIAWLPDGSILVADGLANSRVVKLDKTGKFLMAWGTNGNGPGQFSGLHGIDTDRNRHVYVADRGNSRIQVFDENGKHLDTWPNLRFPDHVLITPDQQVWVSDGTTGKLLKYDVNGTLLYSWGVNGRFPGAHWEFHQFSVDSDGTLYTADSYAGRVQKFRPKPGADRSQLVAPVPLMSSR